MIVAWQTILTLVHDWDTSVEARNQLGIFWEPKHSHAN